MKFACDDPWKTKSIGHHIRGRETRTPGLIRECKSAYLTFHRLFNIKVKKKKKTAREEKCDVPSDFFAKKRFVSTYSTRNIGAKLAGEFIAYAPRDAPDAFSASSIQISAVRVDATSFRCPTACRYAFYACYTRNERPRFSLGNRNRAEIIKDPRDNTTRTHVYVIVCEHTYFGKFARRKRAKCAGCYELYIYTSVGERSIRYFEGRIADRFKSYFIIAVCSAARMPRNKNVTGRCVRTPLARFLRDT